MTKLGSCQGGGDSKNVKRKTDPPPPHRLRLKGLLDRLIHLHIGEEVQSGVRTVFGCPLVQGYGLTETCAGLTVQSPDDFRTGVVGSPSGLGAFWKKKRIISPSEL